MYSFVKGSRLFIKGTRHTEDVDNLHDPNEERQLATVRASSSERKDTRRYHHHHQQQHQLQAHHHERREFHDDQSLAKYSKSKIASASQESKEVYRTSNSRSGLKTVQTQRVIRKTTTVTCGERKVAESISDIIQNDDGVSFKEALLRWAQKTTEGYPGVKITNFTSSWRDGLAFNAILHRNRPDLIDYRSTRTRTARENLEIAFNVAEKDLGVTRLLDPEDVDIAQPDEKSLITYISSLYELFPEPRAKNPLLEDERQRKIEEYKSSCTRLLNWIRECTVRFNDRNWPNTINELRAIEREQNRFRVEELPPKLHEKQRLGHIYQEAVRTTHIEHELSPDNVDIHWQRMLSAYQERDKAIIEEMSRLDKLQRLAERLLNDIKQCDLKLDDIEKRIKDEIKRIPRLNPLDSNHNCIEINSELKYEEERIKSMLSDVNVLRENKYHKATELYNRVQQLYQRWSSLRVKFQSEIEEVLAARRAEALRKPVTEEELIATRTEFKYLSDCIEWVKKKISELNALEYGTDLHSVKLLFDKQKHEHRIIDEFQVNIDKCKIRLSNISKEEEQQIYMRMLDRLEKFYSELVVVSNKRLNDLETLYEYMQLTMNELKWLKEKEDIELNRDWSMTNTRNVDIHALEQYQHKLIEEMERREHHFNSCLDRGDSLVRQSHPASRLIQSYMQQMQSKWSFLLKLVKCLEIHVYHSGKYIEYFNHIKEINEWLYSVEKRLNTNYSKQTITIEEGERLLNEMFTLKEDITKYGSIVSDLSEQSKSILPLKQRKQPLPRPMKAQAICMIKQQEKTETSTTTATITEDEMVTLSDNSSKLKWRIRTSSGTEIEVPGVCFLIPPPNQEAIDASDAIRKQYEAIIALWGDKQHKLRQNMVLATLKIVKGWDYNTYINMDPNQRQSIIKALEEDIDKLVREGPPDDPGSKRLQDEMRELKKKFAEFDARARDEEKERSQKTLMKNFLDIAEPFIDFLSEKERLLKQRTAAPIPRDRDTLEQLVIEHKEFETDLQSNEKNVEKIKESYRAISKSTPNVQTKYTSLIETWDRIWSLSNLYIERLKAVEISLLDIEEGSNVLSTLEQRLASEDDFPSDEIAVKRLQSSLNEIQSDIRKNSSLFDSQLTANVSKVRKCVEKTRPKQVTHSDVNRLEDDVKSIMRRWETLKTQVSESIRSVEGCSELLHSYRVKINHERPLLNQMTTKINTLVINKDSELATRLYESLNERKPAIDEMNTAGNHFIREAKLYDNRCKTYTQSLEEVHPSLDASIAKKSRRLPGTEIVQQELNTFNSEYNNLLESLRKHLLDEKIQRFYQELSNVNRSLQKIANDEALLKPIASEESIIKAQQKDLRNLIKNEVEPLGKNIEKINNAGLDLIRTAPVGVNVNRLQQDLDNLNDRWNQLRDKLNDRERKLDSALQQSGRFQDVIDAVKKWLSDIEEMVNNQKPISSDYKVIKAQLQEQKFLSKLLKDRESSIDSLVETGKELIMNVDKSQRNAINKEIDDLVHRYQSLTSNANERMRQLENILPVAKEFIDKIIPLQDWLDMAERKLSSLAIVPTDQERIRAKMAEHRVLHQDIIDHKLDFEELTEIATNLMSWLGDDEAQVVVDKLSKVTDRYAKLVEDSETLEHILAESHEGLAKFVLSFEDLYSWIDDMDSRLDEYRSLSIYTDKLRQQLDELNEINSEINLRRRNIDDVVQAGQEVMKHSSNEDNLQVKDKLDALQSRFSELQHRARDKHRLAQEAVPLAEKFHKSHDSVNQWMDEADSVLKSTEYQSLKAQEKLIQRLTSEIPKARNLIEQINNVGPQLGQYSPGQGAATLESLVSRASRRFDIICEQIQRKAERIDVSKQKNTEIINDIEELLEWYRDVERQILEAEPIRPNPDFLAIQLKEQRTMNEDVNSQKGRVRDLISNAKKIMRESPSEDIALLRDKTEELKELSNHVAQLCSDRLNVLEQALPLAEHFFETHADLVQWLDEVEAEVEMLGTPGLNALQIKRQQERTKVILQSIADQKPLVSKLNKTGMALLKLCPESEGHKVRQILESDNNRYNALRDLIREQQNALEEALHATSQFSDKLDGMLNALSNTADQLKNAEPIAAHPERIYEQICDNKAILDDLGKKSNALEAVRKAAQDVLSKAGRSDEPAIKDMRNKLGKLNDLWDLVQATAKNRGKSLDEAFEVAQRFWDQLGSVMKTLKELQDTLNAQEAPAVEPNAIEQQQEQLQEIKQEIDQTKPEIDECRSTGKNLMKLCGEPDKPDVKKHIEDLDNAWETVTGLFAKREENLLDAMEKAMNFHEMLQNILEFLDEAECKFESFGPIGSDLDSVKQQIMQLKDFKNTVDPHMVEVEALNRQAQELMERTTPKQARAIREPLEEINRRWDDLNRNINSRQNELDNAVLRLGQFQHALNEFLQWLSKTEHNLEEIKPVFGDANVIEVVLAKHKVLMNDINSHQTSLDTLNAAGKQFMDSGREDASVTQGKLNDVNKRWETLQRKAIDKQQQLEDLLREAQQFNQEIQDLINWLQEIDAELVTSKPVGGLPETAREQLNRFMELYSELERNRHRIESCLEQGNDYVKRSPVDSTPTLQQNLKTLKSRWENILTRANDRKIKLEIALREANEFHEALQEFVDWLTSAEKYLSNLNPVSRVMNTIIKQIDDHKDFQKDINVHRETMLNLDKKGTHLKYFSQKQDVILIKNLLISVQHRWERVVAKVAERSRQLDHGYKETKEFHDAWTELMNWLTDAQEKLENIQSVGNDPERIKQYLYKHKEFQRALGAKQATYDATVKLGRSLKEKAPKFDHQPLQEMLDELKNKWNSICTKSVDRQRKLEEALLFSGQFKDAIQALIDWLDKAKLSLNLENLHGDLDTVTSLVDQHRGFQEDFRNRSKNLATVKKTSEDLLSSASAEDARQIRSQMSLLESKWEEVNRLSEEKERKLQEALKQAEQLHKSVHMLLEWLSDAEMKLRFAGPLPEDEQATRQQMAEHESFLREMGRQEVNKDNTIALAQEILSKCHPDAVSVIKHWITIIQSRWDEVASWARQREQKLRDHLRSLRGVLDLLEELLKWLISAEASLLDAESLPLPDDIPSIEQLIVEHQKFIDEMSSRQVDVDQIVKAFSSKRQPTAHQQSGVKGLDKGRRGRDHLGPRTSTPVRGQVYEPEIRNPKARELLDKWRNVWLLAMERMRRLQDKLEYLKEVDRVKNFDFDEWRRRFLGWNTNKKARIMDFFRKIDTDNDGKVTLADFIEGFLKSKFPTSRLEMEKVAPIFDRNGDGFVDHKEYIDTLRPDRDHPKTDAEIIQDEVQRLVAKCNCVHKYKVFQVGEGKYRFGESQKLRLVRILRSVVMVRVGGGWVSLDEFLVKNDPCRAKGRTNVELREQFILAQGVSQSMTPFISKAQTNRNMSQTPTIVNLPTTGPITKIREKTERSVPMSRQFRFGDSASDFSFTETDSGSKSRPRSRLTVGSTGSRPGSRPSSRPQSRAASDLSTESLEGYQQRKTRTTKYTVTTTGMRRTPSFGTPSATNGSTPRERWK